MKNFKAPIPLIVVLLITLVVGCKSNSSGPDNDPPTADINTNSTNVMTGDLVELDASGSSDPDNDALSYSWVLDKPAGSSAQLSNGTVSQPSFTPDVEGDYTAIVTVDDGNNSTDDASITISATASSMVTIDSNISTNTTWTSDKSYRVTRVINVSGAELVIEAGTQIEFEEAAGLYFNGTAKLSINGTSTEPVLLTGVEKTAGYWKGLGFDSGSIRHTITHANIEYGGNASTHSGLNEAANIALESNVLELTNSTLSNSASYGLYIESSGTTLPDFSTNTFAENGNASALIPSTTTPYLDSGSTFDDNNDATLSEVLVFDGGYLNNDGTISALDVAYRIIDNNIFKISSEVTIGPGTVMEFGEASGLYANGNAKLTVNGENGNPILLTGVEKTDGYWKGIGFDSGDSRHVITFTTIEYGGNASTHSGLNEPANIALEDNVLEISNSTVRNSGKWGIYVESGNSSLPDFSENLFSLNTNAPMYIPPSLIFAIDSASDFTDNDERYLLIWNASTTRSGTVSPLAGDVHYRVERNALLRFNSEVTLDDGVEMEFEEASGVFMQSSSKLVANGTSNDGVLLTSAEDNPTKGFWKGVGFDSNNLTHELTHLTIEYAGGGNMTHVSGGGNLRLDTNSNLSLTNCTITDSDTYGIWRDSGTSVITETGTNYARNTNGPQNTP
ncbi:MAG: PKD domain-containing protein [Gracilimonas sp.]